jgi:hypothetical protein
MEWFQRWGYGLLGGLAFLAMVGYVIASTKRDPETGMYRVEPTLFGFLASYIRRRGGLTRREALGWLFVLVLMSALVIGALVMGMARNL